MNLVCKFCNKNCKNKISLASHQNKCPMNPDRKYISYTKGVSPWNKGLTKDSDSRVNKNAKNIKRRYAILANEGIRIGFAHPEFWTDERRRKKSEWRKNLHKIDPESHPNRKLAKNRNSMSYPEMVAYDYLTERGIKFSHQFKIDKYFADFCIGSIVIEIDGSYWHDPEYDAKRDKIIESYGYKVIRINAKERIIDTLDKIISEYSSVW